MIKKSFLFLSLISAVIIFTLHYFAFKYYWYWNFRWFHIMMHFLGGFWITITAFWCSIHFKHIETIINYKTKAFIVMLASVIIVGICWEIFELVSGYTSMYDIGYLYGFMDDLASNLMGGTFAYLYFIKRKKVNIIPICE